MKIKSQIKTLLWITVAWTIVSLFNYGIGVAAVVDANFIWDTDFDLTKIDFWHGFYVSILTGVSASLAGGSVLVFFWDKWLRSKPYGWTLRSIFISYTIIFIIVSIPTILFNNSYGKQYGFWSSQAWNEVLIAFSSPSLLAPFLLWLVVILLTLVALQVNDKYGPGIFVKFILGQYFNPSKEERVFMFLDLRSSTTIAEKLGEEKYFHFLKDAFKTLTPAVLKNKGEIYQYVGDEMVISWPKEIGLASSNCIECFCDVQASLQKKSSFFSEHYSIVPSFKAGIHYGTVMAGEIGIIKREIAYSGDVLNTTARIQSKCNEYQSDLLISDSLLKALPSNSFSFASIGHIELRGKNEPMQLHSLSPVGN